MPSTKRVSIGVDVDTLERLVKLEKVTGVSRREHLRRAVAHYFDHATDHLTEAAARELEAQPTSARERERLDRSQSVSAGRAPVLRKPTSS